MSSTKHGVEHINHLLRVLHLIPDFEIIGSTFDQWNEWFTRFKTDVRVLDFDNLPNDKKVGFLVLKLKDVLSTGLELDLETLEFAALVSKINDYFLPVNLRQQFFRRRQRPDESFTVFARCLKALSIPCKFNDLEDSIVRDIFILNMHESYAEIAKVMRNRANPSLNDTVFLASILADPAVPPGFMIDPKEGVIHNNTHLLPADVFKNQVINQRVFPDLSYFFKQEEQLAQRRIKEKRSRSQSAVYRKNSIGCDVAQCREISSQAKAPSGSIPSAALHPTCAPKPEPTIETKPSNISETEHKRTSDDPISSTTCDPKLDKTEAPNRSERKMRLANFKRTADGLTHESPVPSQPIDDPVPENQLRSTAQSALVIGECCSVTVTRRLDNGTLLVCRTDALADLHKFNDALNEYYSCDKNRRPMQGAKVGMTCATFIEGLWYRAKILSIQPRNQKTTVRLIDYSHENIVESSEVFVIPKQFFSAPRLTFAIRVHKPMDISVHDILDIKVVHEERGILICDVKEPVDEPIPKPQKSSISSFNEPYFNMSRQVAVTNLDQKHTPLIPEKRNGVTPKPPKSSLADVDGPFSVKSDKANLKPKPAPSVHEKQDGVTSSQPPIPMNQYVEVQVVYISPKGILNVSPLYSVDEIARFCGEFDEWCSEPTNQQVLKTLAVGTLCASLYKGNWYRAIITSVDTQSQIVIAYYYDFGNEEIITDFTRLMILPPKFCDAPPLTFPVKPASTATYCEGDQVAIMLLHEAIDGSWSVLVEENTGDIEREKRTTKKHEAAVDFPNNAVSVPLKASHIPFPINEASKVEIIFKSPKNGNLFAVHENQLGNFNQMLQDLFQANKEPLPQPQIGLLCLAPFEGEDQIIEWFRAEIVKVNRSGTKAEVKYIDVGSDARLPVSQLMVLPDSYEAQPPFAFEFKVPEGVNVKIGARLMIKPSHQDKNGTWVVQIEDVAQSEPATSKIVNAPEKHTTRPLPPIPDSRSTAARVVYKGPEGIFATSCDKLGLIAEIIAQIQEVDMLPLQSAPVVGDLCIAPFEGTYYRAELQSIDRPNCRVVFIDFGNELDLNIDELRQLPPEFASDIFTFKLPDTVNAEECSDLKVRPVFLENEGSWTILVEDGLVGEQRVVAPHEVPLPTATPSPPPSIPFLPADSFTNVRVLYVGAEGAFAAPVDKLESLQEICQHIDQMEHQPLKRMPVIGDVYVAPFENAFYRARVISLDQGECHVVFVDYGNESALPIEKLMEIPPELSSNIFTFKISVDPNSRFVLHEGYEGYVKPISVEPNGSCLVQIDDNYGNPQ